MIPFVDIHCHLLAGLDDGPRTVEEAVEMCEIAWEQGTRVMAATAHINGQFPDVTADRIRAKAKQLAAVLRERHLPMTIVPSAEVMVCEDLVQRLRNGELLTLGDGGRYLLLELPNGVFIDLREVVTELVELGVRPILAHPERHPELLHEKGNVEALIRRGCLVQVSSGSVRMRNRGNLKALQRWLRDGVIHFIASDGHSTIRRPPHLTEAYGVIAAWGGQQAADRIFYTNGLALIQGLPIKTAKAKPIKRSWLSFAKLAPSHAD